MPNQIQSEIENNFTRGLVTEATGLNFPENAATSASNCTFSLLGDVTRRKGIDLEVNGTYGFINRFNAAVTSYVWNNPGGDGNSKLLVKQVGTNLYFYNIAAATITSPLSTNELVGAVNTSYFLALNGTVDQLQECTYADGNGYLFVYNSTCDPFYISYNPVTKILTPKVINLSIRDFTGVLDNLNLDTRPFSLSNDHLYNLLNQGWVLGAPWTGTSTSAYTLETSGLNTFIIQTGLTISAGTNVYIIYTGGSPLGSGLPPAGTAVASGFVNSYTSATGSLVIDVTSLLVGGTGTGTSWNIVPITTGMINTFQSAANAYPSNSDVWWTFKDSTDTFNPASTLGSVNLSTGHAPQGHFIYNAFNQTRSLSTNLPVTNTVTTVRPNNGAWYAGRVWYTGVNANQVATADENFYTWTESIYFSQVVSSPDDFGNCYQTNDPTSQTLNGILPIDGGVIIIVGSGTIFKLFPIANGILVFASNGVWFITGSSGIGFAANDYTVTKISAVKTLHNSSFVDVLGLPFFWNEDGIYQVASNPQGQLSVEPITLMTIRSFYNNIPLGSKVYAKGAYDPINYVIQWVYRSTAEVNPTSRYEYDSILNFNTHTKAFYPYTVGINSIPQTINGIDYVNYPFITTNTPSPGFKYSISYPSGGTYGISFGDEHDATYVDWASQSSVNYVSSFTTGHKFDTKKWAVFFQGQAWKKLSAMYVYTYSRNNGYAAYYIQGAWDFSNNFQANRWSSNQFVEINKSNYDNVYRRHKIRGRGNVLQLQITSVDGKPFDLIGWSLVSRLNMGV